jgi:hypothetical protein
LLLENADKFHDRDNFVDASSLEELEEFSSQ